MVGETLLRERIMREGKVLGDDTNKVSSFVNHMVDPDLIEVFGKELAERLRYTAPNEVLAVESSVLIAGLPVARRILTPLVSAHKARQITISDSFQTTYRSATKGVTSGLILSMHIQHPHHLLIYLRIFLASYLYRI